MPRFAGIDNKNICIISDKLFKQDLLKVIEIPSHLDSFSTRDIIENFKFIDNNFVDLRVNKKLSELKIALVGNWKQACGVSTYSEYLWPEIIPHVNDFKLFIEKNEKKTGSIYEIGSYKVSEDKVIECWQRGSSLQTLVNEIKNYSPDIILIQHEFGIWPNARYWLSMLSQLSEFRVIVIMHSVFHHLDKVIIEAAIPELVVHLNGAEQILKDEKQISGKVYVIPHGCYPLENKERLWNFYKSNHTFIQSGFGFTYKAFEKSIKAVSLLKNKYPDIFFTALFSESPFAKKTHDDYYQVLTNLIQELKLEENVAIIRGYQSDQVVDSYLRTNQVAVFPYISQPNHEVYGASGSARLAMAKQLPVITSSIPHFSDLPTIKANTPEEMANALDNFFSSQELRKKQIELQNKFIEENSWKNIVKKYFDIFEKLL